MIKEIKLTMPCLIHTWKRKLHTGNGRKLHKATMPERKYLLFNNLMLYKKEWNIKIFNCNVLTIPKKQSIITCNTMLQEKRR